MTLVVSAPAKINLTLEVIGKRADGYHEIASIIQTVSLADRLTLTESDELSLEVGGRFAAALADDPAEDLVLRAARELAKEADLHAGAHIQVDKGVPVAMGFGGGSSDAAAALRGLNQLWDARASLEDLTEIGARLGSDVPFFLQGGTRSLSGRGSIVHRLPDLPETPVVLLATNDRLADKTRRMYAALRPDLFTDGGATRAAVGAIEAGEGLVADRLVNTFDALAKEVSSASREALSLCRAAGLAVHLGGAGPGLFVYGASALDDGLTAALAAAGVEAFPARTLGREEATRLEEA